MGFWHTGCGSNVSNPGSFHLVGSGDFWYCFSFHRLDSAPFQRSCRGDQQKRPGDYLPAHPGFRHLKTQYHISVNPSAGNPGQEVRKKQGEDCHYPQRYCKCGSLARLEFILPLSISSAGIAPPLTQLPSSFPSLPIPNSLSGA